MDGLLFLLPNLSIPQLLFELLDLCLSVCALHGCDLCHWRFMSLPYFLHRRNEVLIPGEKVCNQFLRLIKVIYICYEPLHLCKLITALVLSITIILKKCYIIVQEVVINGASCSGSLDAT